MAQKLTTTTADVVIAFQQNPGIDNDSIIDAGYAKNAADEDIQPVQGGYYGLKFGDKKPQKLRIFGTTYNVVRKAKDEAETSEPDKIIYWKDIWTSENQRIQHYLQLLGYYAGTIDGSHQAQTELALLGFQADNGYRTGGYKHSDMRNYPNEIKNVVNKNCKVENRSTGEKVYLLRRPLLRFDRAPSADDPTATVGPPDPQAPEVDNRGWVEVKANDHMCKGPVVSMARNSKFRVKVIREGIGNKVDLIAESEDSDMVEIEVSKLTKSQNMILKLKTKDPGDSSKKVQVYIKWINSKDEKIIIATLSVIVMPVITVFVQPCKLGIKKNKSDPDSLPTITDILLPTVLKRANAVWHPYGIKFESRILKEFHALLSKQDIVSKISKGLTSESMDIFKQDVNHARDAINLYFVKGMDGAFGMAISPFKSSRKTGIIVVDRDGDPERTGCTLAHELGHFLGLANNYGRTKYSHAEDDPNFKPAERKSDLWTIKRLMLGHRPSVYRKKDKWCHNPGYGNDDRGRMISLRNLPEDKTDDECRNARKQANSRSVYG